MVCPPSADLLFGLVQDTVILGWEMLMLPASLTVMDSVSVLDIFSDQARIHHHSKSQEKFQVPGMVPKLVSPRKFEE